MPIVHVQFLTHDVSLDTKFNFYAVSEHWNFERKKYFPHDCTIVCLYLFAEMVENGVLGHLFFFHNTRFYKFSDCFIFFAPNTALSVWVRCAKSNTRILESSQLNVVGEVREISGSFAIWGLNKVLSRRGFDWYLYFDTSDTRAHRACGAQPRDGG